MEIKRIFLSIFFVASIVSFERVTAQNVPAATPPATIVSAAGSTLSTSAASAPVSVPQQTQLQPQTQPTNNQVVPVPPPPSSSQNLGGGGPSLSRSVYVLGNRYSRSIADDGYPLRLEGFVFTDAEIQRINELETIRSALKREQRRLTKIYVMEHPIFKNYTPAAQKALIAEFTGLIDTGLDNKNTMADLNLFGFENFRNYLLRVSSFVLSTRHYKVENPTGEPPAPESTFEKFIPKKPLEYMVVISFFLILVLFGILFIRIK